MPSLSESFPTIGLLVSGTRKLFSRSKKQPPVEITDAPENLFADDSPSPESEDAADLAQIAYQAGAEEIASEIEEPDGYTLEAPTPVDPPFTQGPDPIATGSARNLPSALEESPTIPGLYETWVELEERVKRAQNELQAILATREEAAILRGRAQKRLDEGESIRADAARISESAWRAFDRGFAVSAKGLPNRWTTVREIDEAMRTHTALQRATHSESWQEADRTRQRATTKLLKALAVLNTAMAQAQRELKEAANLPSVADALMQSAQEELRCAQAIRSELLLLGKEALNELDAPPYVHQPGPQEITISDPQDFAAGFLADAGLLGATPPVISEPQRVPPSAPVVEPSQAAPSLSDALSGQASVAWESPKEAEPAAVPEPETPNHEIREQVGPRMGGGFEAPEPPAAPAPPEPAPIPQPTFEAPEAAPPSDWFTQAPTNAEPSTIPQLPSEVPEAAPPSAWFTEEKPLQQNETPVPQAPPAAPPPTAPPVQAPSEAQILEEEIAAATPASESLGSAAAAMAEELARGMGGFGVSPGTGEPPERIVIEAAQPPVPEAPAPPVEPQGVVIEMPASPQPNAAEQLRRDMEAATPPPEPVPPPAPADAVDPSPRIIEMPEPRQQPTAAELLRQEMAAATPPPAAPAPQPAPPPQAPQPPVAQQPPEPAPAPVSVAPPEASPQAPAKAPGTAPAATYTGRIFLMFPSSLSQGRLESVWEVLDQVAGTGNITDTRLVSREAGIQFTLDLGSHELNIAALQSRFSDATIIALEEDRLRIEWPSQ